MLSLPDLKMTLGTSQPIFRTKSDICTYDLFRIVEKSVENINPYCIRSVQSRRPLNMLKDKLKTYGQHFTHFFLIDSFS